MLSTNDPFQNSPENSAYVSDYLKKINFNGSYRADLSTLQSIHLLHPATIPFENLNPFLKIPVHLDIASLFHKMVYSSRGGYCLEQNLMLGHVLKHIGFKVRGIMARTLYNQPEGLLPFRGHMLLLVEVEGIPYIADVGFGALTLTSPLRLDLLHEEQETPHETFRMIPVASEFKVEAKIKEEWRPLYQISLHDTIQADYELTSWHHCNFPSSRFRNQVIITRTLSDRRITLFNDQYAIYQKDGSITKRSIENVKDMEEVMQNDFGIVLSDGVDVGTSLSSLFVFH